MRVTSLTPRAYEFACHAKACAPPPAGKGGSLPQRGGRLTSTGITAPRHAKLTSTGITSEFPNRFNAKKLVDDERFHSIGDGKAKTTSQAVTTAKAGARSNVVKVKMSANGVPWAAKKIEDNPLQIFQAPPSKNLKQYIKDHPVYRGVIAPGKHQVTADNPQDIFQSGPKKKVRVSATSKAAAWWRARKRKQGATATAYA